MSSAKIELLQAIIELEHCGELDGLLGAAQRAGLDYRTAYQLLDELRAENAVTAANNGSGAPIDIQTTEKGRSLFGGASVEEMSESELLDALRYRVTDPHGKRVLREINSRLKTMRTRAMFGVGVMANE